MQITGHPGTYFIVYLIEKLTAGLVRLDRLGEQDLLERPRDLVDFWHERQMKNAKCEMRDMIPTTSQNPAASMVINSRCLKNSISTHDCVPV